MNRIREIRVGRQRELPTLFSQQALAYRLRISPATLYRWETGRTIPTRRHARALAKELGVPIEDLALDQALEADS